MKKNKIVIILTGVLIFHAQIFLAQDLKDPEHTLKFADYLFRTRQFELASEEYERLVFFDSLNYNSKLKLIKSYRFSNNYKVALEKFDCFFKDSLNKLRVDFAEEYLKNLILDKKNQQAYSYLDKNISLEQGFRQTYQLGSLLLERKWDTAFHYALKHPVTSIKKNADLHVVAFQSKQAKYKKPFGAAVFSAIIPGTGKMYTKNWKDGFISLMFVGVNTWQAYRGFNKSGKSSVYGWVFTGFATSFYIGNVFGSYKSAKKYNKKLDDEIYNKAWHLVVDDF
jgi:hypothetical protein